jgi:hypothetical protein
VAATLAPAIPTQVKQTVIAAECGHPSPIQDLWEMPCGTSYCWDCAIDHQRHARCRECDDYAAIVGEDLR